MELLTNRLVNRRRGTGGLWLAVLGLAAVMCAYSCSYPLRTEQADQGEQVDVDTFLHEHLQKQPMVTVAEAYRAMVLLADGKDEYKDFDARRTALEERGILRPEWDLQREACIDRGSVAYMVYRIVQLRGGVNMEVFGRLGVADRRYAVRELVDRELMTQGAEYRYMTGGELVDLLAKADQFMAKRGLYEEEAVDLEQELGAGAAALATQPAGVGRAP